LEIIESVGKETKNKPASKALQPSTSIAYWSVSMEAKATKEFSSLHQVLIIMLVWTLPTTTAFIYLWCRYLSIRKLEWHIQNQHEVPEVSLCSWSSMNCASCLLQKKTDALNLTHA
jgi:choline-glycine betaine transporter